MVATGGALLVMRIYLVIVVRHRKRTLLENFGGLLNVSGSDQKSRSSHRQRRRSYITQGACMAFRKTGRCGFGICGIQTRGNVHVGRVKQCALRFGGSGAIYLRCDTFMAHKSLLEI